MKRVGWMVGGTVLIEATENELALLVTMGRELQPEEAVTLPPPPEAGPAVEIPPAALTGPVEVAPPRVRLLGKGRKGPKGQKPQSWGNVGIAIECLMKGPMKTSDLVLAMKKAGAKLTGANPPNNLVTMMCSYRQHFVRVSRGVYGLKDLCSSGKNPADSTARTQPPLTKEGRLALLKRLAGKDPLEKAGDAARAVAMEDAG